MTLKQFLNLKRISMREAAEQLGVPYEYIRRYINEGVIPSKNRMKQIVSWSDGIVQPNDFYEEPKEVKQWEEN